MDSVPALAIASTAHVWTWEGPSPGYQLSPRGRAEGAVSGLYLERRDRFEEDALLPPPAAGIIVTLASFALWGTVWLAVFQLATLLWAHHA